MNFKILILLALSIVKIQSNPLEGDVEEFQLNKKQIEMASTEDLSINRLASKTIPIDSLNINSFNTNLKLNDETNNEIKIVKRASSSKDEKKNKTDEELATGINENDTNSTLPFNVTNVQTPPVTNNPITSKTLNTIKMLIVVFVIFIILAVIHIISNLIVLYKLNQNKYKYLNLNDKSNKNNENDLNSDEEEEEADIDIKLIANKPKKIYTSSNSTNKINVTVENNDVVIDNVNDMNNYQYNKDNTNINTNTNINNNNTNNNNPSQFNIVSGNNEVNNNNVNNEVINNDEVPREFLENMILSSVRNPQIQSQIMQLLRCPNDDQLYTAEPIYEFNTKDEKKDEKKKA